MFIFCLTGLPDTGKTTLTWLMFASIERLLLRTDIAYLT